MVEKRRLMNGEAGAPHSKPLTHSKELSPQVVEVRRSESSASVGMEIAVEGIREAWPLDAFRNNEWLSVL